MALQFDVNNNCLIDDEVAEVRLQVFDQTNVSDSILGAYCHFYEEIRNYAQEDSEKISNLISAIKNDFKLIHLSLSETEQAEKIFESINATGRMLSNFDYLRNNLFLRARNLGKNEDGKFYRDIFYEDSDYWRFENESNYWSAEILESFLRAFLMATWNPKCFEEKNTKPFGEYQKYSKSLEKTQAADEQRIRYEFQQLSGWAKSYRALQDDPDFDIYVRFREDLSLSDDLDSLLLFVKHNCPDQLDVIYEILESYIVRRVFVLENAAYNHAQIIADSYTYINSFFSAVVTGGVPFSIGSFAQFLRNENWPENQDILDAFNQLNSKNVDFIAYLFREIVEWDKKRTLLYGREPLRLGAHKDLLERIQHLLDKDPGRLMETFNEIWPPPFHFTQNF